MTPQTSTLYNLSKRSFPAWLWLARLRSTTPKFWVLRQQKWSRRSIKSSEIIEHYKKKEKAKKVGMWPKLYSVPAPSMPAIIIFLSFPSIFNLGSHSFSFVLRFASPDRTGLPPVKELSPGHHSASGVLLNCVWSWTVWAHSWLHHIVSMSLWTSYLNSLYLSFFICKIGALVVFISGL